MMSRPSLPSWAPAPEPACGTDLRANLRAQGPWRQASARPGVARIRRPLRSAAWPGLGRPPARRGIAPRGGGARGARALGGATSVALAAVRAGQARAGARGARGSIRKGRCTPPAWSPRGSTSIECSSSAPPRAQLARVAVKVVGAGAFEVVVVDFDAVPGASTRRPTERRPRRRERPGRPRCSCESSR